MPLSDDGFAVWVDEVIDMLPDQMSGRQAAELVGNVMLSYFTPDEVVEILEHVTDDFRNGTYTTEKRRVVQ